MRLKSAYRPKPPLLLDTKVVEADPRTAESLPEEPIQPSETTRIEFTTDNKAEPAIGIVSADEYPQPDEATLVLQKQIADLKKSEELQREYGRRMAQQQQQPPTHQQLLQAWRSQGADEGDLAFLESNPPLMDNPRLCRLASDEAAEHHQRGTDAHREATREIFLQHLALQQAQPAAPAEPAPAFFRPEPTRSPAAPPDRSSLYAAPVSRQTQSASTGQRPARTVRLTAEQQEYARVAGVSDTEYARQLLKLTQAKANGDYGERR